MKRLPGLLVIVSALSLASCAQSPRQAILAGEVEPKSATETLRLCEDIIYRASYADRETSLQCAHYLDIWR